jgi:class 3 adenylate cyclase
VVTILFTDVVGSSDLAARAGPETWKLVINEALDRTTRIIHRYEGTITQLVGDGLWAFFGAPVAHEDDPVRAVRAALDIIAVASDYAVEVQQEHGLEFAMRACLHTGPVVVGSVGDDLAYHHQAVGVATNLAARLKFAAEPMSVVASDVTVHFIAPLFSTEDRGMIKVPHTAEPVQVYRILEARSEPGDLRGLSGLQSPMVGRDRELGILLQLCDTVRAGLGRAVVVSGEPGLGKTRLISEWRQRLSEGRESEGTVQPQWAEGRCLSYGAGLAYHLLIDLVRAMIGVSDTADELTMRTALEAHTRDLVPAGTEEVLPYLAHLLLLEGETREGVLHQDPQALQTQYLAALRKLLQAMALARPLVLVLEDLHWADPSSVDLLVRLLPVVSQVPILLCMVTRAERDAPGWRLVTEARETLGSGLTEITLGTLSDSDSRQLVANLLAIEALPEELRALILRKSEGNPFFVEEVIRMLIQRGAIVPVDGGWAAGANLGAIDIPDNLQGLLMARIDRLPPEARDALRVASVIGRQFPIRILEYVLDQGP